MFPDADSWISRLNLAEHPEGGYYARTYRSAWQTDSLSRGPRVLASAIYYLLKGDQFSALHRIQSDEIWHFYEGSPLTVFVIDPRGNLSEHRLGRHPERGERFQLLIEAGQWFGATIDDPLSFTLVGCTVSPGFEFEDFELADRTTLIAQYPQHQALIERLTRGHPQRGLR